MSWGYHAIFPPHKYTQDKADSPPYPSNADNDNAAYNNADDNTADNNTDNDADVDADNDNVTQAADNNSDATRC